MLTRRRLPCVRDRLFQKAKIQDLFMEKISTHEDLIKSFREFSKLLDDYFKSSTDVDDVVAQSLSAIAFTSYLGQSLLEFGKKITKDQDEIAVIVKRVCDFMNEHTYELEFDSTNLDYLKALLHAVSVSKINSHSICKQSIDTLRNTLDSIDAKIKAQNEERRHLSREVKSYQALSNENTKAFSVCLKKLYETQRAEDIEITRAEEVLGDLKETVLNPPEKLAAWLSKNEGLEEAEVLDCMSYSNVRFEMFGSILSRCALANTSDVDVCLGGLAEVYERCFDCPNPSSVTLEERPSVVALRAVKEILEESGIFSDCMLVSRSRVPVLKCVHTRSSFECDIASGNYLGMHNTALLAAYCNLDPRVRELIIVVKYWAKRRGIADASQGTLSSYAWVLLVIFFLQQEEASCLIPSLQSEAKRKGHTDKYQSMDNEEYDITFDKEYDNSAAQNKSIQIGTLFFKFFQFYLFSFDITKDVVSIRQGSPVPREQLDGPYHNPKWRIAIEDPFELLHDLGSKIINEETMKRIRMEMMRALKECRMVGPKSQNLDSLVERVDIQERHAGRCLTCGSVTHAAAECVFRGVLPRRIARVCRICFRSDHYARDCPHSRHARRPPPRDKKNPHGGGETHKQDSKHAPRNGNEKAAERTDTKSAANKNKKKKKKPASGNPTTKADPVTPPTPGKSPTHDVADIAVNQESPPSTGELGPKKNSRHQGKTPKTASKPKSNGGGGRATDTASSKQNANVLCKMHLLGGCKYGAKCRYQHVDTGNYPPGM